MNLRNFARPGILLLISSACSVGAPATESVSGQLPKIGCGTAEDMVRDHCLSEDSDHVDLWACLMDEDGSLFGGVEGAPEDPEAFGRACCQKNPGYDWCADMPTELTCETVEQAVFDFCAPDDPSPEDGPVSYLDCLTDEIGNSVQGVDDIEAYARKFGSDCCENSPSYPWCDELPQANVRLEAKRLHLPAALNFENVVSGYMAVKVEEGLPFSPLVLARTLAFGDIYFGDQNEDCDGVPRRDSTQFSENNSVDNFLDFLRNGTEGWTTLDESEIADLEGFLDDAGKDSFRVFWGQEATEACGGDGTVSYNLIWTKEPDATGANKGYYKVIYLILYPYSE